MGRSKEVWECFFECERVRSLHEHEGHGRSEEDDVGILVLVQVFAFKVSTTSVSFYYGQIENQGVFVIWIRK